MKSLLVFVVGGLLLVGCGFAPQTTKIKLEILKSDKDTPVSLKIDITFGESYAV